MDRLPSQPFFKGSVIALNLKILRQRIYVSDRRAPGTKFASLGKTPHLASLIVTYHFCEFRRECS
ncbi:hypothetical protein Pla22_29240 [Rubripirellula amarantea]|uniref:Uncharacterized protein n=1 Tax=Rubripirellula amarantea TaxID=2527999 RepID=A0A5C5WJP3_9BACT|nr:hypothetical protein Pla22_29240 [Rubripirellula amarantea]